MASSVLFALTLLTAPPPAQAAPSTGPGSAASAADPIDPFIAAWAETYRFRLGHPSLPKLSPDGRRAYFLRAPSRSFARTLYVQPLDGGEARPFVTAEALLGGREETLTPEERARRERLRLAAKGIAEFTLSKDGRWLLVPLAGQLHVVDADSGAARALAVPGGPIRLATPSPDGAQIAFVQGGRLRVVDRASGRVRALPPPSRADLTQGAAEFVAEEEMDRHEGYWWSPDSRALLFSEVDEAEVEQLNLPDVLRPDRAPSPWRYPRAGRTNAAVRLYVASPGARAKTEVRWDHARYPYLARVAWSAGAPPLVVVQDRLQREVVVLAADVRTGATRVVHVERDAAWVNLYGEVPRVSADGQGFLWITEAEGAPQLIELGLDGTRRRVLTAPTLGLRALVGVARGRAIVLASDDPTAQAVWSVPLDGAAPTRLGAADAFEVASLGDDGSVGVRRDTLDGAPRVFVLGPDGTERATLPSVAEAPALAPRVELTRVDVRADGQTHALTAGIVRPRDARPGVKLPVIVSVYGGPHARVVERVRDKWLLAQWLAERGAIVVSVDNRGTPGRGRDFERAIAGRLVSVPLHDQAAALEALARRVPELDLGRASIFGWSFGGTMAAMAALRRPELFRRAVAGAPVTDWRDYDTHYTERYLGLPSEAAAAYDDASPIAHASPKGAALMLVHGTADDNVYFFQSLKLSDALFRAGHAHTLLPLAGFTHMVPDPAVASRLYVQIARFLLAPVNVRGED